MSEPNSDRLLSRQQAAEFMNMHPDTIYLWARKGILKAIKLPSGQLRYRQSELEAIKRGEPQGTRFSRTRTGHVEPVQ